MSSVFKKQSNEILAGLRFKVDTTPFEKELKELESKYKNFDAKVEGDTTKIRVDTTQANAAIQKSSGLARNYTENIAKIGIAFGAVSIAISKAFNFVTGFKDAARDATEISSKYATVFKDIKNNAEQAASALANDFGIAVTTAKQLLGDPGDILTGFGFDPKTALDLSDKVNRLAIDLASFTNFAGGAKGASDALTKALLGESESVKALGIVIRQDSKEYKNLVENIQKTQGVTLIQAKALAALEIATKQSKNAIGDFARTQDDLANVERRRIETAKQLKIEWGEKLVPVFTLANKALIKVFDVLGNDTILSGLVVTLGAIAAGLLAVKLATISWNLALLANPVTGIIAGVTALGVGLTMLANKLGGWGNLWQAAKDYAIASLTIAWDYMKAFGQGIVNFGKLALDALLFPWRAMWESVKGIFSKLGEAWKMLLTGDIKGALSVMGGEIVSGFSAAFDEVKQSAGTLWNTFDGLGTKAAETWRSVQVGATETKEAVIAATDEVTEKQENFVAQSGSSLKVVGRNIDTNLTQKLDKVQVKWKQTQVKLTESEKNFVNIFRGIGNQMSSILSGAFTEMADKGVLSFKRILQGFKHMVIQMVAEIAGRALLLAFLTSIGGGSLTTWTGLLSGGKASSVGSYLLGSFASGGVVPGGEKVIRVNEEGEEFVMNHRATRILGTNFLNSIMAFPEHFKALFSGLKMPSLPTMPQPAYAFASGGSTQSAAFPDMDRYMDRLDEKLDTLIEKFEYIRNLRLVTKIDNEKIAVAAENGRTSLESREL